MAEIHLKRILANSYSVQGKGYYLCHYKDVGCYFLKEKSDINKFCKKYCVQGTILIEIPSNMARAFLSFNKYKLKMNNCDKCKGLGYTYYRGIIGGLFFRKCSNCDNIKKTDENKMSGAWLNELPNFMDVKYLV